MREPMLLLPLRTMVLIDKAMLPKNPRRMHRDTHPDLIAALMEFKSLLAEAQRREGPRQAEFVTGLTLVPNPPSPRGEEVNDGG